MQVEHFQLQESLFTLAALARKWLHCLHVSFLVRTTLITDINHGILSGPLLHCVLAQPNNNFFSFWFPFLLFCSLFLFLFPTSNTVSFLHFHLSSCPRPMQQWIVYEQLSMQSVLYCSCHYRYKSKHLTSHGDHLPPKQTEFVNVDQGNYDIVRPFCTYVLIIISKCLLSTCCVQSFKGKYYHIS